MTDECSWSLMLKSFPQFVIVFKIKFTAGTPRRSASLQQQKLVTGHWQTLCFNVHRHKYSVTTQTERNHLEHIYIHSYSSFCVVRVAWPLIVSLHAVWTPSGCSLLSSGLNTDLSCDWLLYLAGVLAWLWSCQTPCEGLAALLSYNWRLLKDFTKTGELTGSLITDSL